MSAKKKKGPTFVAKKGNVEIKVYTNKPGCPNEHHTVCYYEDGKRQRQNFSDLEKAKAEAKIVAEKLSKGDLEAIRLTGLDRQAYLAAQDHLRPTGRKVKIFESADPQSFRSGPMIAYDPDLAALSSSMNWKRLLAYITGSVDQELLLRNEYLATEN